MGFVLFFFLNHKGRKKRGQKGFDLFFLNHKGRKEEKGQKGFVLFLLNHKGGKEEKGQKGFDLFFIEPQRQEGRKVAQRVCFIFNELRKTQRKRRGIKRLYCSKYRNSKSNSNISPFVLLLFPSCFHGSNLLRASSFPFCLRGSNPLRASSFSFLPSWFKSPSCFFFFLPAFVVQISFVLLLFPFCLRGSNFLRASSFSFLPSWFKSPSCFFFSFLFSWFNHPTNLPLE